MSAHLLFILNLVRSAECIWWCSGFGVQLVGMWSGMDGMPNLISLKWTSDRSLNGSPMLDEINLPCNHECRGCTGGGSWRRSGNEVERGGKDGGFLHRTCPFESGKLFHLLHTWLMVTMDEGMMMKFKWGWRWEWGEPYWNSSGGCWWWYPNVGWVGQFHIWNIPVGPRVWTSGRMPVEYLGCWRCSWIGDWWRPWSGDGYASGTPPGFLWWCPTTWLFWACWFWL